MTDREQRTLLRMYLAALDGDGRPAHLLEPSPSGGALLTARGMGPRLAHAAAAGRDARPAGDGAVVRDRTRETDGVIR
jgi:hypothetical protein